VRSLLLLGKKADLCTVPCKSALVLFPALQAQRRPCDETRSLALEKDEETPAFAEPRMRRGWRGHKRAQDIYALRRCRPRMVVIRWQLTQLLESGGRAGFARSRAPQRSKPMARWYQSEGS